MGRVIFDAGHAGFGATPGKRTPDGEYEWGFNDKVVDAAVAFLKDYPEIKMIRVDDPSGRKDIPLKERTDRANYWKGDIYISVHHNAYLGNWGTHTGTETYTYIGNQPGSTKLAKIIHPKIVKEYGLRDRGIKQANFHVVRETNMPAILIEGGYMDSRIDIEKLRDDKVLKNVGIAIGEGVLEYFGIKKKVQPEQKPTPKPIPKPKPQPKEEDEMLEKAIVINSFADFPNAEVLANKLKAPIYMRSTAERQEVAKEVIVIGGSKSGIKGKVKLLSGADRYETAAKVKAYLK